MTIVTTSAATTKITNIKSYTTFYCNLLHIIVYYIPPPPPVMPLLLLLLGTRCFALLHTTYIYVLHAATIEQLTTTPQLTTNHSELANHSPHNPNHSPQRLPIQVPWGSASVGTSQLTIQQGPPSHPSWPAGPAHPRLSRPCPGKTRTASAAPH